MESLQKQAVFCTTLSLKIQKNVVFIMVCGLQDKGAIGENIKCLTNREESVYSYYVRKIRMLL